MTLTRGPVLQVKQSRKKPLQVRIPRALPTMEAHQVIRANALFLLSLSSAAEPNLLCHHPAKPFHAHLPSLKEGVSDDLPGKMGCLYLQMLARYAGCCLCTLAKPSSIVPDIPLSTLITRNMRCAVMLNFTRKCSSVLEMGKSTF